MPRSRRVRPVEILVVIGILLALIVPVWQRIIEGQRQKAAEAVAEPAGFAGEEEAARELEQAADRPTGPQIVTVAGFIAMAVIVPTLLLRQWLRERKRKNR